MKIMKSITLRALALVSCIAACGCGVGSGGTAITAEEKNAMDAPPKPMPPEARQKLMEMSRKMAENARRPPSSKPR